MQRIKSFEVDHTKLKKGMYISRIDDDIVTYDIRMCKPNGGKYLDYAGMHSFEHLFATYARNSKFSKNIIYVGPMGCRTGFYLVTRNMSHENALTLVRESMKFIGEFEGMIPGVSEIECGNYKEHDGEKAKIYGHDMYDVLSDWSVEKMEY